MKLLPLLALTLTPAASAAPSAGQVRGVGITWYGSQDTSFGTENFIAQLMTFAMGKATPTRTALKWPNINDTQYVDWGNFQVTTEQAVLPGGNAAMMSLLPP